MAGALVLSTSLMLRAAPAAHMRLVQRAHAGQPAARRCERPRLAGLLPGLGHAPAWHAWEAATAWQGPPQPLRHSRCSTIHGQRPASQRATASPPTNAVGRQLVQRVRQAGQLRPLPAGPDLLGRPVKVRAGYVQAARLLPLRHGVRVRRGALRSPGVPSRGKQGLPRGSGRGAQAVGGPRRRRERGLSQGRRLMGWGRGAGWVASSGARQRLRVWCGAWAARLARRVRGRSSHGRPGNARAPIHRCRPTRLPGSYLTSAAARSRAARRGWVVTAPTGRCATAPTSASSQTRDPASPRRRCGNARRGLAPCAQPRMAGARVASGARARRGCGVLPAVACVGAQCCGSAATSSARAAPPSSAPPIVLRSPLHPSAHAQCAPGKVCGDEDDGCGGRVLCGPGCTESQNCNPGGTQCVDKCVAITQCDEKYKCGTQVRYRGRPRPRLRGRAKRPRGPLTRLAAAPRGVAAAAHGTACTRPCTLQSTVAPCLVCAAHRVAPCPPRPRAATAQPNKCGGEVQCGHCASNSTCNTVEGTGGTLCVPIPCNSTGTCLNTDLKCGMGVSRGAVAARTAVGAAAGARSHAPGGVRLPGHGVQWTAARRRRAAQAAQHVAHAHARRGCVTSPHFAER